MTVTWLGGREGGRQDHITQGSQRWEVVPKKRPLNDASERRGPRGKASEMTEVSGNLGVFAVFPRSPRADREKVRSGRSFWQFGRFGCVPWAPRGEWKKFRFDRRIKAPRAWLKKRIPNGTSFRQFWRFCCFLERVRVITV